MTALLTHEEVYARVRGHLLAQKKKAQRQDDGEMICAYRGRGGTKCAIGCLIPDELYSPDMEGLSVSGLICGDFKQQMAAAGLSREHVGLCEELQTIHDCGDGRSWPKSLPESYQDFVAARGL